MVRFSYCEKTGLKKGAWSLEEDRRLSAYVTRYGHWNWCELPKFAGLQRCGKSCRLRWMNYLRPNIRRGNYTKEEEDVIINLHEKLGNRWSAIAAKLPGRTDNEIKNHWHTNLKKRSYKYSKPKHETKIQPLLTSESKDNLSIPIVFESSSLDLTWLQKTSGCGKLSSSSSDTNSEIQLKKDRYMSETFEDLCETLCIEPFQVEDYFIEEDFTSVGSTEFVLPDSPFFDFDDGYVMTSHSNELTLAEFLSWASGSTTTESM